MNRLMQLIVIAAFMMVLAPAQAMVNIDAGLNACQVFAADDSDGGEKKDGDKKEGEEEEEEPDCE
jgi:hypothetical protein